MRIASRVVGVVLVLAGLVFLGLSVLVIVMAHPESVLEGSGWDRRLTGGLSFIVVGAGFVLGGWHYLKLDVDQIDDAQDQPASRFAPYFLGHRREFRVIAQIGLVISLIRLGAACFGRDWPGRWAAWPLVLTWIALVLIGIRIAKPRTMDMDWQTVPEGVRPALKAVVKAIGAAFLILTLVLAWSQWFHHRVGAQLVQAALIVLAFACESLFFAYGEVTTDREVS